MIVWDRRFRGGQCWDVVTFGSGAIRQIFDIGWGGLDATENLRIFRAECGGRTLEDGEGCPLGGSVGTEKWEHLP